jgi:hypothetical protein
MKLFWPALGWVGMGVPLVLIITSGALFLHSERGKTGGKGIYTHYRVTNTVSRLPSINPSTVHLKMTGTPGMAFEVRYTVNGNEQMTPGTLPGEVSFVADAFSARITALGAGIFNFDVYRDDSLMGSISGARLTNGRTWQLDANKGGKGFRMTRLMN